jgi:16S rRNA G527 N7-methylase RsmG
LIEAKLKKANFLHEVLANFRLKKRAQIVNRQFEEIIKPNVSYVSCRALDKFTQKLPRLLKWSAGCALLFFGGNALRDELKKNKVKFKEKLMPMSEQRFLFIAKS